MSGPVSGRRPESLADGGPATARLFTAILPDEPFLGALCAVQQALRPLLAQGRITRRENLHLTMAFLGEADAGAAVRALETVDSPPVRLTLAGVGSFPGRAGRTVWAGVEPAAELAALYERAAAALRRAGFAVDARPYRPHVTLARDAVPEKGADLSALAATPAAMTAAPAAMTAAPAIMTAGRLSLMRSDFTAQGVRYTELYARELK